ncbi:MAG: FGGY-family carbohydrate kinase [Janthinobacterium lividum]
MASPVTTGVQPCPAAPCFVGIDVGTGSARAGIFDATGRMLASAKRDLLIFREAGAVAEQSSTQIWNAITESVRDALAASGLAPDAIRGIGFDATCSLVVLDEHGRGLAVGRSEDSARDVILWMDHRARDQARRINAGGHPVLAFVGGQISPEMQTPKLLWLAENRASTFAAAGHFFDLVDFLTWRATDSFTRSGCTVTCKWTYLGREQRWDETFFRSVGLGMLADEQFRRIGTNIASPGTALGAGLTARAATELGLLPGTPVAAGLIDAHAGGVGTVGARDARLPNGGGAEQMMAYVMGTSSCTMTSTVALTFAPGIWGPYRSAMVPGLWLLEGGQSAAGAAIVELLRWHPLHDQLATAAAAAGQGLADLLAERALLATGGDASATIRLADGLHVVPEFLGNRAPHADPYTRAAIVGLGMDADENSLIALYVAGIAGLGYGLRQILLAQEQAGARVSAIVISGGAGRSALVRQLLADATGLPIAVPEADEPVLLGAAMLGSVASGTSPDLETAMAAMSSISTVLQPGGEAVVALHKERFVLFELLQTVARAAARSALPNSTGS